MPGVLTDLTIAGKLLARTLFGGHHQKIPTPQDTRAFRANLDQALDAADSSHVKGHTWLTLAATQAAWVGPRTQVWGKIGDGDIISATRLSHTVTASTRGHLTLTRLPEHRR
jgi:hypothetical protein